MNNHKGNCRFYIKLHLDNNRGVRLTDLNFGRHRHGVRCIGTFIAVPESAPYSLRTSGLGRPHYSHTSLLPPIVKCGEHKELEPATQHPINQIFCVLRCFCVCTTLTDAYFLHEQYSMIFTWRHSNMYCSQPVETKVSIEHPRFGLPGTEYDRETFVTHHQNYKPML